MWWGFLIFHSVVVFRGIKVHLLNKVAKVSNQYNCEHSPLVGLISLAAVIIKRGYLERCRSWCLWGSYVE